ncbi:MAG: 1-deoxy-D-xylulose-5-phosphate reductoisomerase [Balneolaceae bacterium]|nr:1-deoxy-D-xylulose-5-phosphate reductoisomerase [Balneolaceae bacterium]
MNKQKLVILGSTGSIGTQTLDIVRQHRDKFGITALTANSNWELLAQQIDEFNPRYAVIRDESCYKQLKAAAGQTHILAGFDQITSVATLDEADIILNSLVGYAGFESTYEAIKADKKVALANKESLVVGGELIQKALQHSEGELLPVDSEHSAMLQCLAGESVDDIEKIVITASGGPFREFTKKQMEAVTVEQALNHPNWDMGAKVTIDSSTMMNKGLEIIEAHWLFNIPVEKIEPVIHPQSIIHSMVTFRDGSSKAQLGLPDMKVPITYALGYPERLDLETPRIDWAQPHTWTFEPVDYNRFPCLRLAMDSIIEGGFAPAVLNAANEVAVKRFLNEEISYIDIPKIIDLSLKHVDSNQTISVHTLKEIDEETRKYALSIK